MLNLGDLALCNDNLITGGAMLALGFTNRYTGGRNCLINNFGVTKSRYSITLLFTAAAVSGFNTFFGASRIFRNRPFTEAMFMAITSGQTQ